MFALKPRPTLVPRFGLGWLISGRWPFRSGYIIDGNALINRALRGLREYLAA
jgi:hypothetical protein